MSRVYFTSRSGEAELRGSERAYCGGMVTDLFMGCLSIDSLDYKDPLRYIIPSAENAKLDAQIDQYVGIREKTGLVRQWFEYGAGGIVSDDRYVLVDGEKVNLWEAALNTALTIGNKPIQLMARLHAQCEIHAWVEGEDRQWLADIMREGRAKSIYRPNMGWEEVIEFLQSSNQEEVVMHYSVSDTFPSPRLAREGGWKPHHMPEHEPDDNYLRAVSAPERCDACTDSIYDLPREEFWDFAMAGLRKQQSRVQCSPDDWDTMWFGGTTRGFTAFDMIRAGREIAENLPDTSYGRIYTRADG